MAKGEDYRVQNPIALFYGELRAIRSGNTISHTYALAGEKTVEVYSLDGVDGITSLVFVDAGLVGTLLSELTSFTALRHLDLRDNQLTGSIPFGIDKLVDLEELRLDRNAYRFGIPTILNNLKKLRRLTLSGNGFSNYVSGAFSGLLALEEIDLSDNGLSSAALDALVGDLYLDRASHTAPSKVLRLEGGGNASPGATALTQIGELESIWGWIVSFN